jgi:hypothetical protein
MSSIPKEIQMCFTLLHTLEGRFLNAHLSHNGLFSCGLTFVISGREAAGKVPL